MRRAGARSHAWEIRSTLRNRAFLPSCQGHDLSIPIRSTQRKKLLFQSHSSATCDSTKSLNGEFPRQNILHFPADWVICSTKRSLFFVQLPFRSPHFGGKGRNELIEQSSRGLSSTHNKYLCLLTPREYKVLQPPNPPFTPLLCGCHLGWNLLNSHLRKGGWGGGG